MKEILCLTCSPPSAKRGHKLLAILSGAGVEIMCPNHGAAEVIPFGVIDRFRKDLAEGREPRLLPDASAQRGGLGRAGRRC